MDLRRCDRAGFGEGWVGEWTLEAPGTPEGKFTLEQAMNGEAVNLVWEVVIERSGHGKLWLKSVNFFQFTGIYANLLGQIIESASAAPFYGTYRVACMTWIMN